jgi:uncharacterized membrane protein YhaH (DUF805 family)
MSLSTRICGWIVALMWLVCSVFSLFYVYFLLTFNILMPTTVAEKFRGNYVPVIGWSLFCAAFFAGALAVLLRRTWARGFSFFLCAIGVCFALAQIFLDKASDFWVYPIVAAGLAVALLPILVWLVSNNGRTYFGQLTVQGQRA